MREEWIGKEIVIGASKRCPRCGEVKSILEFGTSGKNLNYYCRECNKEKSAEWRRDNTERIKELQLAWRNKNRDKCKELVKKWRKENHDRNQEYNRNYYAENGTYFKNHNKEYYEKNQKKVIAERLLNAAIKKGHIARPETCSICGKQCKPDGHHSNYDLPYDVVWVCRGCHKQLHNDNSNIL